MTSGPLARTLIAAVKLYRALPRSRLPSCRFDPTCSQYALDALRRWGGVRGGWLAFRRICRCHPWGGWGYDPVPAPGGQSRRGHRAVAATGLLEH